MMKSKLLLSLLLGLVWQQSLSQQPWDDDDHQISLTIPEVSLVGISPASEVIKLVLYVPGAESVYEAGSNTNSSTWLNYTTSCKKKYAQRKIMVKITSGEVPKGVEIKLEAKECSTGKGKTGISSSPITISYKQQTLVSGIGGSCTGKGKNFGHQLIYTIVLADINKLEFEESNTFLTVTYTISD